jgi:dTDP-4-amino-4,6-dideoxygalactose transaminase
VTRLYLSPPDVGPDERALLVDAFDSNWIAPLGPHVDAFEAEFSEAIDGRFAAALSSGTAALHLALLVLGVGPGDEVVVPTLTFVATANAVRYVGACPIFVDSEPETWNLDPRRLEQLLVERERAGRLPAAVLGVDLYGQCADWSAIGDLCTRFGIRTIEDAAEALGARHRGAPAGAFGDIAVFSFNGNKIITTSGGGMLVSADPTIVERARYLSTQARVAAPHYEHTELGFNYRMSNLLAAVGRGQLRSLETKVSRRRAINARYRELLADASGIGFMPNAPHGEPTNWLTVVTVDAREFGATPTQIREHLETLDIEARPAWKPMHMQPAFSGCQVVGGAVAERIFSSGLCLPSGSAMTDADVERVTRAVLETRAGQ